MRPIAIASGTVIANASPVAMRSPYHHLTISTAIVPPISAPVTERPDASASQSSRRCQPSAARNTSFAPMNAPSSAAKNTSTSRPSRAPPRDLKKRSHTSADTITASSERMA